MYVQDCTGLRKTSKRRQKEVRQHQKTSINDKLNLNLTNPNKTFRSKYLETLFSNGAIRVMETDSAEGIPTDNEIGSRYCKGTKQMYKVKSKKKFESLHTPSQHKETRNPDLNSTINRANTVITSHNVSTFYTCRSNNNSKPRPQLPLCAEYPDDGKHCCYHNQCNCNVNCGPLPERRPEPRCPPPTCFYDQTDDEPEPCEWCLREEARRRRALMRNETKYCRCGMDLQGLQYTPSFRPLSRWRPPSRFSPRPERCCEPFIPYSHRHDSKYHQHCVEEVVPGQERGYIEDPWVQPARYRRTVPSQRCSPPPTCCRNLPVLRRSTVPSKTSICYR